MQLMKTSPLELRRETGVTERVLTTKYIHQFVMIKLTIC